MRSLLQHLALDSRDRIDAPLPLPVARRRLHWVPVPGTGPNRPDPGWDFMPGTGPAHPVGRSSAPERFAGNLRIGESGEFALAYGIPPISASVVGAAPVANLSPRATGYTDRTRRLWRNRAAVRRSAHRPRSQIPKSSSKPARGNGMA